jgi:hypothetical protein
MDILEAKKEMVRLLTDEIEFYKKHFYEDTGMLEFDENDYPFLMEEHDQELVEQFMEIRDKVKVFSDQMATVKGIREEMVCWIVNIVGESEQTEKSYVDEIETILHSENDSPTACEVTEVICSRGTLPKAVVDFFKEKEYEITETGLVCGGWNFGTLCNDEKSFRVCDDFNSRFQMSIEKGYLKVVKEFIGFRFPDLMTYHDVKEWSADINKDG